MEARNRREGGDAFAQSGGENGWGGSGGGFVRPTTGAHHERCTSPRKRGHIGGVASSFTCSFSSFNKEEEMGFTRTVTPGRVALVSFGEEYGSLVAIADVLDSNRVRMGKCGYEKRQEEGVVSESGAG